MGCSGCRKKALARKLEQERLAKKRLNEAKKLAGGRRMPRNDAFLWDVCLDIYREMYNEAKPSLNFDKALKRGIMKKENWFMAYYLSEKAQIRIINYHCKKHHLTPHEIRRVDREILLGAAPNSSLKTWQGLQDEEKES